MQETGRGAEEREREREKTERHSIHGCVFFEKVFKEKLRSDRNVSFAEMDGALAVASVFVPSIVALYPLCQPEVG